MVFPPYFFPKILKFMVLILRLTVNFSISIINSIGRQYHRKPPGAVPLPGIVGIADIKPPSWETAKTLLL